MTTAIGTCGDDELIKRCLDGDRDSFTPIVKRYQSLICAVTYSACGDLQFSEDLAQTTFLTAWRNLTTLKEPATIKSWLCGIARHLCADFLRHKRRTIRSSIELSSESDAIPALSQTPDQFAITHEEQVLLWRSVASLPASLREPIVLFYRQDQSIREVAEALDLSEEAVRQRLSRGRAMLRDSLTSFIQHALQRSSPSKAFTLAVVAALPLTAASAKAAATTAAVKTAKVAAAGGIPSWLTILIPPAVLGGLIGWRMRRDAATSAQGQAAVQTFWRIAALAIVACTLPPLLLTFVLIHRFPDHRDQILSTLTFWMGAGYIAILLALAIWILRRRKAAAQAAPTSPRSIKYPLIGMLTAAGVLLLLHWIDGGHARLITREEAQAVIRQDSTASFSIHQTNRGDQHLVIGWPPRRQYLITPMDPTLAELLKERGAYVPILVQGKDWAILGLPGLLLPLLCVFVIAAGAVMVIGRKTSVRPASI